MSDISALQQTMAEQIVELRAENARLRVELERWNTGSRLVHDSVDAARQSRLKAQTTSATNAWRSCREAESERDSTLVENARLKATLGEVREWVRGNRYVSGLIDSSVEEVDEHVYDAIKIIAALPVLPEPPELTKAWLMNEICERLPIADTFDAMNLADFISTNLAAPAPEVWTREAVKELRDTLSSLAAMAHAAGIYDAYEAHWTALKIIDRLSSEQGEGT